MSLIFSIHDATAETLDDVQAVAQQFRQAGGLSADVLVVCGSDWAPRQIDVLRRLEEAGFRLQGHGWTHRAGARRHWYHHLHSAVLSRDVAEHLSKSSRELTEILQRCAEWFPRHRLQPPTLYVPPAWALGAIDRTEFARLPFRYYETLTGVLDVHTGRFLRLPLQGYESDTWFRAGFLRLFNRCNRWSSAWSGRPLRISVHPPDRHLYLRNDLQRAIRAAGAQGRCDLQSVLSGMDSEGGTTGSAIDERQRQASEPDVRTQPEFETQPRVETER